MGELKTQIVELRSLCSYDLPHYAHVEVVIDEEDNKKVIIHSTIHKGSPFRIGWSYGESFSIGMIMSDAELFKKVKDMLGLKLVTRLESK